MYFKKFVAVFGLAVCMCLLHFTAAGQVQQGKWQVFAETFDGPSNPFTNVSGLWETDANYSVSAPNAYRGKVPMMPNDMDTLETPPYNLAGYDTVVLRFSHICKVDPNDIAQIEYAFEVGAGSFSSWTQIPYDTYLGDVSQYRTVGFNSAFYGPLWRSDSLAAKPVQSDWWKEENFDITYLAAFANIKFRFVLKKGATYGTSASYGWLIDNFEIRASNKILFLPMADVAPDSVVSPGVQYNTGDPLSVQIQNKGQDTIKSINIYWKVNGGAVNTTTWSGTLLPLTPTTVVLNSNFAPTDVYNQIVIWTSDPNNVPDEVLSNDTIRAATAVCNSGLSGSYTIGASGMFPDISTAVSVLERCGISGAVDFTIQNGTYTMPRLKNIQGMSASNTVTFRSQSGNPADVSVSRIVFDTISNVIIKDLTVQVGLDTAILFTAPASNVEMKSGDAPL